MIDATRLVVTGAGVCASLGPTLDEAWRRLVRGESAVGRSSRPVPAGHCQSEALCPVAGTPPRLRQPKLAKYAGRAVTCALHAVVEAVNSARAVPGLVDPFRIAVHTATGQTGLDVEEFFPALSIAWADDPGCDFARLGGRASRLVDPHFSLRTLSNACLALVAAELQAKGPSCNFVQGELAVVHAVRAAAHDLREGRADLAVVVACDSLVHPSTWLAYERQGLLSRADPSLAHAPFDRGRDGVVLGEGAAALVIEREGHAAARGQPALAGLVAAIAVAGRRHALWSPDADALADALTPSGTMPSFVVARGLGTVEHDRFEAEALAACLPPSVPVTALKGATGYLGAATLLVGATLAIRALREGLAPPVTHLVAPDPRCRLPLVRTALDLSAGSSGSAAILAADWAGGWGALVVSRAGVESRQGPPHGSQS